VSDYVTSSSLTTTLGSYVTTSSMNELTERVDTVETITNRFSYEPGTTNLHFEYESTFDIEVGDFIPMMFRNDGTVTIDKLILGTAIFGGVTIRDGTNSFDYASINENGLTVSKLNGVSVSDYALVSSLSDYVTSSSLTTTLGSYALVSSLSDYVTSSSLTTTLSDYALTTTLGSYATTSSLTTVSNRVTSLETKTTSLSYIAAATTISNVLKLPVGQSIDPTNANVYYGSNVRIEKWWTAPWGSNVNDALILLDHVNTAAYGNNIRMLDGRLNLFRHPGAWSHGVYVDIQLIHYGIETVPQVANISYVSYNVDGSEPHAREPRLALVTHTASSKQYIALHIPFYVNTGRLHFSGIMSTLSDSIPMTMCLPSDGYTIDVSPYDVYSRKQEWNHGLRCTGIIDAPNVVALETKASGFNTDGTELTLTKLNGVLVSDYVTSSSLTTTLANYALVSSLTDYALVSSLTTVSSRVTTVENKTSKLSYTSLIDLLTMSSNVTLSKFMLVNGTSGTSDSVSVSCPNGKVVATNVSLTNKDDIDSLTSKTSGFNTDGSELTVTKLNGHIIGGGIPSDQAPWIATIRTDGVTEVGRILDFHTDYANVTTDYTCRVTCSVANTLSIPNISVSGTVAASGNVTGANITTLSNKVSVLETKTTGISYSEGVTTLSSVPKIGSESLIDFFYPIGTVYQSSDVNFDPNTKWGGTWVKVEGRFLFGSDSTRSVGSTGGSDSVTLGLSNIPDHTHQYSDVYHDTVTESIYNSVMDSSRAYAKANTIVSSNTTSNLNRTGDVQSFGILPPYMVVNVWNRTA